MGLWAGDPPRRLDRVKGGMSMARNRSMAFIKRMVGAKAPNGYKFDLSNYLCNPSRDHDYPSFIKKISEDETTETFRSVHYIKFYNGTGEYVEMIFSREKAEGDGWAICKNLRENTLEPASRFSLNKLLSFC